MHFRLINGHGAFATGLWDRGKANANSFTYEPLFFNVHCTSSPQSQFAYAIATAYFFNDGWPGFEEAYIIYN